MKKIAGNSYLKKKEGKILIDQVSLDDFLSKYKTPLLIFLENRIRQNINSFTDIFNSIFENFQCFYSFKANFLNDICKIIKLEGVGAEIISLPELKRALKIGFSPNKILVGGPYLPKELIEKSIENNVKEIIVYNIKDLQKINFIAKKFNIIQDICLRINSQKYNSRLGVKLNENNINILNNLKNECNFLRIKTILSHYGTQLNNIDLFRKNIKILANNLKILRGIGFKIKNINLGGGFPEAAIMPKKQLENIAFNIKKTLKDLKVNYENIYFEPGRYFVGDTAIFISDVINVNQNRWAFLNIGNHICPKFARCSLRFYNASKIEAPHKYKTSFAGIMPTDQDVLIKDYFFTEEINEGDHVLVTNVGAYCLTFSNRFPYELPKIFIVKNNEYKEIFNPSLDNDFSIN